MSAKNYGIDLNAIQKAVCADASMRVVFIANPNNPTGTMLSQQAIADFIRRIPSHTNFILLEVGNAQWINQQLLQQGIIIRIRPMAEYGLNEWIRISIGTTTENQLLIRALRPLL